MFRRTWLLSRTIATGITGVRVICARSSSGLGAGLVLVEGAERERLLVDPMHAGAPFGGDGAQQRERERPRGKQLAAGDRVIEAVLRRTIPVSSPISRQSSV